MHIDIIGNFVQYAFIGAIIYGINRYRTAPKNEEAPQQQRVTIRSYTRRVAA